MSTKVIQTAEQIEISVNFIEVEEKGEDKVMKKEDLEETLISIIGGLQQDFDNELNGSYKTRIEISREICKQVELLAAIRSL